MINKFDTITDFINFYSEQAKTITPPNDKTKDSLDRIKCDLELSISKDEVLRFCENAIKQFQSELILFFNNNYKIDYNLKLDELQWQEDLLYTLHYYLMYKELKEHQQPEAVKPPSPQKEINVFSRTMPLNIPKEHFEILTTSLSKNKEPFLTDEQYNDFINRAFLGKTDLPKLKFNKGSKEQSKIQYLFYQFYQSYSFEYFGTGQVKDEFIKLLTDNFDGWEFKKVFDNWNKPPLKRL